MPRLADHLLRLVLLLALAAVALTAAGLAVGDQLGRLGAAAQGESGEIVLSDLSERSYVYASDGTLIATLQEEENRAPISIEDVPDHVVDAVLAVEDAGFWSHEGLDIRATVRALLSNVESGGISQGGSTITQQLVKQSLLSSEQDLDRKTREAFLAMRLEKQMSKPQILERYLNTIYLGNHAYGVQAAAETYFGKEVTELDVGEAALLAGLIRDPIDSNPFRYPEVAVERRRLALERMVAEGVISEDDAAFHAAAPLPLEPVQHTPPPDDYFVEEVKQQLLRDPRLGATATERFDAVFRGGLQIHTTLDPQLQFLAEAARNDVLSRFSNEETPALFTAGRNQQGEDALGTVATATVQPDSGAVRSLIGGPGFGEEYKFNLATQGYRQPGSAFKIFVLLELLEQGYAPQDRVSGRGPCRFEVPGVEDVYRVQNFGNSRGFVGSIRAMTTNSSNCGFLRLGQVAGIDSVTALAGELGIKTRNADNEIVELDPTIFSTPLGTQEVTPIDMAAASAAIANDGFFNPPYYIERVLDREGEVLIQHKQEGYRAISVESAQIAADILRDNVLGGTGWRARVPDHDIGGKTGTAQDFSNAWFVGFSRQLATAVWMGAIEGNVSMQNVGGRTVTGGSYPAQIFGQYMGAALEDREPEAFADPPRRRSTGYLRLDRTVDLSGYVPRRRSPSRSSPAPTTTAAPETDDGGNGDADGGGNGNGNGNGSDGNGGDGNGGDGNGGDGNGGGDGGGDDGSGSNTSTSSTPSSSTSSPPTSGDYVEP